MLFAQTAQWFHDWPRLDELFRFSSKITWVLFLLKLWLVYSSVLEKNPCGQNAIFSYDVIKTAKN